MTEETTPKNVFRLVTPADVDRESAINEMCMLLDEIKAQVTDGSVQRMMIITDGDPTEDRMEAAYNRYVFGEMRKAEMVGLASLAAMMDMD